jgi:hypothetical protein
MLTCPSNGLQEFQIMDADEPWDFDNRFDYVHTRLMNGFSIKSWPFFYEQAYQALQPGGWFENQEFEVRFGCDDDTLPADSACVRWAELWNEGIEKFGLTGRCYPERMKEQAEAAGFINVTVKYLRMPIGTWPKNKQLRQSGLYTLVGFLDGISGLSIRTFTHGLGWRVEEMEVLLAHVRNECQNRRIHSYFPIYVVCGQKPPLQSAASQATGAQPVVGQASDVESTTLQHVYPWSAAQPESSQATGSQMTATAGSSAPLVAETSQATTSQPSSQTTGAEQQPTSDPSPSAEQTHP